MDYQKYNDLQVDDSSNEQSYHSEQLKRNGFFKLNSVIDESRLEKIRPLLDKIHNWQNEKYGENFLKSIGDFGTLRTLFDHDELFFDLIMHPKITDILEYTVGSTAIMHLQNGIYNVPATSNNHNQARYHKDFPKNFVPSQILSINFLMLVDDYTEENGATWIVPGSHNFEQMPSEKYLKENQIQVPGKAGDIYVFDSMLWHKAGTNFSQKVRRGINHQFTKPFIKQQLDYPAFLKGRVDMETPLAQRLGLWTIPPKGTEEYRVKDHSKRTYRAGQG